MITLPDGAQLHAPGGVFIPGEGTLVVADVHAGYVATLQRRGMALPSVDDEGLLARLRALLDATRPARVVIAGDIVHGATGALRSVGERSPLAAMVATLKTATDDVIAVPGNHDRGITAPLHSLGVQVTDAWESRGWAVLHGDEDSDVLRGLRALAAQRSGRLVIGHFHPALMLDDGAGTRAKVPAFAYAPGLLILPALTPFARGADLSTRTQSEGVLALATERELSVAVVIGGEVLPVGTLARARAALHGGSLGREAG